MSRDFSDRGTVEDSTQTRDEARADSVCGSTGLVQPGNSRAGNKPGTETGHAVTTTEGAVDGPNDSQGQVVAALAPTPVRARLDADRTAKPMTEIVGVFPEGKKSFFHNAESLIARPTEEGRRTVEGQPPCGKHTTDLSRAERHWCRLPANHAGDHESVRTDGSVYRWRCSSDVGARRSADAPIRCGQCPACRADPDDLGRALPCEGSRSNEATAADVQRARWVLNRDGLTEDDMVQMFGLKVRLPRQDHRCGSSFESDEEIFDCSLHRGHDGRHVAIDGDVGCEQLRAVWPCSTQATEPKR
jgi:hypothetical protein